MSACSKGNDELLRVMLDRVGSDVVNGCISYWDDFISGFDSEEYIYIFDTFNLDMEPIREIESNFEFLTPLMVAAYNGQLGAVKALIEAGCDVDAEMTI